jgi:molecular chaperone GrpE (heat shock protein)
LESNFRYGLVVKHRLQCSLHVNLIKGSTLLPASWFKRWFGRSDGRRINLGDISALIDALSEVVSANEGDIQRRLRRLSMAQKQQSDAIALLTQESASLKFTLAKRHGLILTYEHILQTLDNLAKINHAATNVADHRDVIAPLTTRTMEDLLSLCELEMIAVIGKRYPARNCEVIGAVETLEQAQCPPGTVVEVLQQGYQTIQGDVVRTAKVIVSRETKAAQTNTQLEGTENAN